MCMFLSGWGLVRWNAGTLPVHLQHKQKKKKISYASSCAVGRPAFFLWVSFLDLLRSCLGIFTFSFFDPGPSHSYHALSFIPCTRINMQKNHYTTLHYTKPCRPAAESTATRQSPVGRVCQPTPTCIPQENNTQK